MASSSGIDTFITQGTLSDEEAAFQYVIRSMLSRVRTSMPVEVVGVTNNGGVSKIGLVNIKPLVSMIDGAGGVIPHQTIYNVPYMRIQGGTNAIILDPKIGDIGIAAICDRDITGVKETESDSPPSSKRMHDITDAVYLNSIISAVPVQYIQFSDAGINIVSPVKVKVQAPQAEVVTTGKTIVNATGNVEVTSGAIASITATTSIGLTAPNIALNGNLSQTGGGTATFSGNVNFTGSSVSHDGVNIGKDHKHSGVQSGGSNTGNPI